VDGGVESAQRKRESRPSVGPGSGAHGGPRRVFLHRKKKKVGIVRGGGPALKGGSRRGVAFHGEKEPYYFSMGAYWGEKEEFWVKRRRVGVDQGEWDSSL